MDLTGMVSIIPLGSRTDAGIDLGLLGLIVVGWGQRWSRPGLARSCIFPKCCQVPGKGDNLLQPPHAQDQNHSTEGVFHPRFCWG